MRSITSTCILYLLFTIGFFFNANAQPFKYIQPLVPPFPDHLNPESPQGRVLGPGLFNHISPIREVHHASGGLFAGHTPEGQLYVRNESEESYAVIASPQSGWRWDVADALWSPDGKTLLVKQVDDRKVPRITLSKGDSTVLWPYSMAGESLPKIRYYFVDVATGNYKTVLQPSDRPYVHPLSWHPDGTHVRMVVADRFLKNVELRRVHLEDGRSDLWLTEKSDTYLIGLDLLNGYTGRLRRSNVFYFLDATDRVIYSSERTGYNQLYLYGTDGNLIRQLTKYEQNGVVIKLIEVDQSGGWVYYAGLGNKDAPYDQQLYKCSLDGKTFKKLVDGPTMLEVYLTATKDSLWVWSNDMERSATLDIYNTEGKKLQTYWSADMSPLDELGLKPEFVQLKAADNQTMIEAMVFKPKDFDPDESYPVVEWIYGAAHTMAIRRDVYFPGQYELQNLANTGHIVVIIDGRGTPDRGKAFQDYSYGKFGQVELADHVKALRTLAEARPYMDLDRLGIAGHSWGGHYALRAVLEYPDIYKAAYLSAAAIDPSKFRVAIEPYIGCLPQDCPKRYAASALTPMLDKLKARLMINHGTADDDVPFADALYLVEKLKERGYTNYKLVEYPGMDHIIMMNPKWEQRMIDFFKKSLMD